MSDQQTRNPLAGPGAAFVEGEYVPLSEARIPILDWGFTRSDATYDVVGVWGSRFFRLEDHLDRFLAGAAKLRLDPGLGKDEIRAVLIECVRRAELSEAYVEMIVTRGMPPAGSRDPRLATNKFLAFAIPYVWIADEAQRKKGLNLAIGRTRRISPESVDPTIKNYHWLDLTVSLLEALDNGAESVLLLDSQGRVTEGPGFNLFAVKDGRIATPESGVLLGITRRTVLELAEELAIPARAGVLSKADLETAEELFITSTAGGVMPVTSLEGEKVGNGQIGAITTQIHDLYWAKHSDPEWTTPVG